MLGQFNLFDYFGNLFCLSTDGGRTFDLIQSEIGKQSIRSSDGIFKSPVDPKRVIFLPILLCLTLIHFFV